MAAETLEARLSAVETELRQLKQQLAGKPAPATAAGWQKNSAVSLRAKASTKRRGWGENTEMLKPPSQ